MLSKVRIGNHALHPMLVVVPAGAFIMALVFDVVYIASGTELWWTATLPLMLVGVIGAVVAAIPGFVDLFTVVPLQNATRQAVAHMVGNLVIVVLFAWNAWLRWTAVEIPPPGTYAGFWLSLVGVALLAGTGWLGWKMVQEYHVGVLEHPEAKDPPPAGRAREAAD